MQQGTFGTVKHKTLTGVTVDGQARDYHEQLVTAFDDRDFFAHSTVA